VVAEPTHAAFAALPEGTLTLLKPESHEDLVDILIFHVINEKVLSTDLKATQEVMTVQSAKLLIKCSARRLRRLGRSLHGLRPSAHLPRNTRAWPTSLTMCCWQSS